jgi:hypothetical protein
MSNRLFRLSELLAPKYGFKSIASDRAIEDIKNAIIEAYNLYVTDETVPVPKINPVVEQRIPSKNKNRIIPELAGLGESTCVYIFKTMKELMKNIVGANPDILYVILGRLKERMTDEKVKDIINFYQDKMSLSTTVDLRLRKDKERQIRDTFKRLSSVINNKQRELQKFTNKTKELEDKSYHPPVQPISKENLVKFMRMPFASQIGLTDYEILSGLLDEPGGRELITNVYNSLQSGHIPKKGTELMAAIVSLKNLYNTRANKNTFEQEPSEYKSPLEPAFEEESLSEPSFRSPIETERVRKEKEDATKGEGI